MCKLSANLCRRNLVASLNPVNECETERQHLEVCSVFRPDAQCLALELVKQFTATSVGMSMIIGAQNTALTGFCRYSIIVNVRSHMLFHDVCGEILLPKASNLSPMCSRSSVCQLIQLSISVG